ncbi:hypothetical protein [Vallitalea maricola]|uniref:Uncharacterized protein n=1 Tax=Vallitalea maricola TaxID=3074433 RepID=A0ACB5UL12_9FIRM|nr:hypothetical protein AN2V17_28910 [Vallitalea sp. AN17-2]
MLIKSEMTAFGTTTSMNTYYDGNKSRTEIDVPGMAKSILIHLPNEEVMYQYVYGEETGVKMTGANASYAEEMGLMMDTSMLAEITDASSEDMIARVETLDGEEVIYIEATQSDEDMGDVLVKMWYSKKYATPLKYEVYMGETLMTNLKVIKITDSIRFSGDEFVPPKDVTFQEMDMQSMMAEW